MIERWKNKEMHRLGVFEDDKCEEEKAGRVYWRCDAEGPEPVAVTLRHRLGFPQQTKLLHQSNHTVAEYAGHPAPREALLRVKTRSHEAFFDIC